MQTEIQLAPPIQVELTQIYFRDESERKGHKNISKNFF